MPFLKASFIFLSFCIFIIHRRYHTSGALMDFKCKKGIIPFYVFAYEFIILKNESKEKKKKTLQCSYNTQTHTDSITLYCSVYSCVAKLLRKRKSGKRAFFCVQIKVLISIYRYLFSTTTLISIWNKSTFFRGFGLQVWFLSHREPLLITEFVSTSWTYVFHKTKKILFQKTPKIRLKDFMLTTYYVSI